MVVDAEGVEIVRRGGDDLCLGGVIWCLRCVVGAQAARRRGKPASDSSILSMADQRLFSSLSVATWSILVESV